jgi:DNA-binding transcriptional LysR family regulator
MDLKRLRLLLLLARHGSIREVADIAGVTTSTVSQQIAALARDVGTPLIEPQGRRVRLTPAGRRLAEHATGILAAVDVARRDLDPAGTPAGTVRVAGFATAVRRSLLPAVAELASSHPAVGLRIHEHEPAEAIELLQRDEVDLALVYDYNLAPEAFPDQQAVTPLWSAAWGLGVPPGAEADVAAGTPELLARFADFPWIVNSRNTADEVVVRTLASLAGYRPRVVHRADSLELVQDMLVAGLGVALLHADQPTVAGVSLLELTDPEVVLRSYAVTRGPTSWAPLALVLRLLTDQTAGTTQAPTEDGEGLRGVVRRGPAQ